MDLIIVLAKPNYNVINLHLSKHSVILCYTFQVKAWSVNEMIKNQKLTDSKKNPEDLSEFIQSQLAVNRNTSV